MAHLAWCFLIVVVLFLGACSDDPRYPDVPEALLNLSPDDLERIKSNVIMTCINDLRSRYLLIATVGDKRKFFFNIDKYDDKKGKMLFSYAFTVDAVADQANKGITLYLKSQGTGTALFNKDQCVVVVAPTNVGYSDKQQ